MKLVYRLVQKDRLWIAEHASSGIGPIRVTASTREEALQKLEGEIRYWLEQLSLQWGELPQLEA